MIGEVSLETFPIRQRPEDIPLLFEYFIRNIYNNSALRWTDMCSEELWNSLTAYSWPGNGKEIENLCKYVYCFHSEGKLTIRDLPAYIRLQMAKKNVAAFSPGKTGLTDGGPESEDRAGRSPGNFGE